MTEQLRSVLLTAEIDTTKDTHRVSVSDLPALVEWWNDHAAEFGLTTYTLIDADDARGEAVFNDRG